jgi:hypothetical protein
MISKHFELGFGSFSEKMHDSTTIPKLTVKSTASEFSLFQKLQWSMNQLLAAFGRLTAREPLWRVNDEYLQPIYTVTACAAYVRFVPAADMHVEISASQSLIFILLRLATIVQQKWKPPRD